MRAPDLAAKVAFLSDPRNHPFDARTVTVVETHMSWVFLTESHAYKLKKAMRLDGQDLSRVETREAQCRNEVELNRRLTQGVYLGVMPLTVNDTGSLQLDLGGTVVDWLVWMRRLPEARMLDRLIASDGVDTGQLRACIAMLGRFYRTRPPEPLDTAQFRARIAQRIAENATALKLQEGMLAPAQVEALAAGQRDFLARHCGAFDRRVIDARVVEGHGDLRPEHICLEASPQVIDCLEFSRELRIVDPAEELGFLALECERLGAPRLQAIIFEAYAEATGDHPSAALVDFYQSLHAFVRAKLAMWHVSEPGAAGPAKWVGRARDYLRLADLHLAAALGALMTV
jgi:aminoglycoside phosphotransferase family enzyme